jgi:hypothetical protein
MAATTPSSTIEVRGIESARVNLMAAYPSRSAT